MSIRGFGDLESQIMDRLWDRDRVASVREIHTELAALRPIAYTTVMSTMDNLHRKGWLARHRVGKAYQYWPTMSREKHSAELMRAAFDSGGNTDLVLSFFVEQMNETESARLRDALRRLTEGEPA